MDEQFTDFPFLIFMINPCPWWMPMLLSIFPESTSHCYVLIQAILLNTVIMLCGITLVLDANYTKAKTMMIDLLYATLVTGTTGRRPLLVPSRPKRFYGQGQKYLSRMAVFPGSINLENTSLPGRVSLWLPTMRPPHPKKHRFQTGHAVKNYAVYFGKVCFNYRFCRER